MRVRQDARHAGRLGIRRGEQLGIEQRRQGRGPDADGRFAEELPAGEVQVVVVVV
jgi:hypothetical protein